MKSLIVMNIDLSKTFETVEHKILLDKSTYCGISETYIQLFKSYFDVQS